MYSIRVSSSSGSLTRSWRLGVRQEEAVVGQEEGGKQEVIVPDETVKSGDISDPEFLQIMVRKCLQYCPPKFALTV